jgi:hypothetical protein
MKMTTVPVLAVATVALAAPLACLAAPSSVAAHNCAQAFATRLDAHLAAVNVQPNLQSPLSWAPHNEQYILTARAPHEIQGRLMVCTVDRYGQVLSLNRPAPTDTLPLLDAPSQ